MPHGEARVWAVKSGDEVVAWLKRHRQEVKARQEQRAYEQWLPALPFGAAPFLGVCPDAPRCLLTLAAPGVPALSVVGDRAVRVVVMRRLGALLRHLHDLDVADVDAVPLAEALPARCDSWCARGAGVVDDDLLDGVRRLFDRPLPESARRVPCHRDLHLGNVIVDLEADPIGLTLIDYGQARMDLWLADLVKLFQVPDDVAPDVWRAFFEGYGRRMRPDELPWFRALRALHGVATWTWAWEHGDEPAQRVGRRVVEDALAEDD